MIQLTARMVRAYKGAAISILMLFLSEGGRALSQGEMRRGTGYQDEAISDALQMLREDGLVVESGRYQWSLLDGMRQLPLGDPTLPSPRGGEPSTGHRGGVERDAEVEARELGPDDPELALNESMNQSDSIDIDDSLIDSYDDRSGKTGADGEVTAAELRGFGFYGRGLQDLLAIRGLTLREVRYHVKNCSSLGGALWRLKKRQGVPASFEADVGHQGGENPYLGGKYADFVVH